MSDRFLSRRHVMRGGAVLSASAALAGAQLLKPVPALAAVPEPEIHSTASWGARPPTRNEILNYRPTYIVIHHTATSNDVPTTIERAYDLARGIQNYHMDQGWGDSGQQFTTSRGGFILEGRHNSLDTLREGTRFVRGIHAGNSDANANSIGIENEGTYTSGSPPQWEAMVHLCAYLCTQYGIPATQLFGHRQYSSTSCPGDGLYGMLPQLRQDVQTFIDDNG
ncbi:MAG: peptidoglycan recognition protein family protein [Stackebrandtia sp.]